ncbi:MAG TPA: adenylate/guanylate cyclase domain-containing protein, partial [Burkholderiaceae bacterium]|nr:adenylate/guanylate cyclase domain-containing protein [Burkholderiaceae bacterium]
MDVVESVRLLLTHEDDVIGRWRRFVADIRDAVLPKHGGRLVKSLGDGMLLEFESVIGAVSAAMELHSRVRAYNVDRPPSSELHLRAGLHNADIVVDELDVYGAGVNLASRLAALAGPDETIISPEARDAIVPGLDIDVEDLGECYLKHFTEPQRAYRAGPVGSHSVMWSAAAAGSEEAVTVAVIPFASHGDGDTAFVGDALADDLIVLLSRVPQFHVISRLSTAAFRNRSAEPQTLMQALGCQYAVHGTCVFIGDQVRVRAQLTDCTSSAVVWADAFDSRVAELLGGASPMIERIAHATCTAMVDAEIRHAQTASLPSLRSYTILLGAIALMHRLSPRDFERAREMLLYLCERHPRATSPRAWLGKWHVMRVAQGWSHDPHADAQ